MLVPLIWNFLDFFAGCNAMETKSENKSILKNLEKFILDETSLSLSLAYVILIGIGMLFSYQYYGLWGIDVFLYAGFGDFLLAPFKDMILILFVVISVLGAILVVQLSRRLDRKFPRWSRYWNLGISVESKFYNRFQNFNLVAGILIYLHFSSLYFAWLREKYFNINPEKHRIEVLFDGEKWNSYFLLGLTERYLLVLSEEEKRVIALPLQGGIKSIRFPSLVEGNK